MTVRPRFVALSIAACGWISSIDRAIADPLFDAAIAYEAGRCPEVLQLYQALPQGTYVDGVSHYRWGFCLAEQQDPQAREHYEQAATLLGREAGQAKSDLPSHFYRVNSLLNLERNDEARSAAQAAVNAWRAGTLTVPAQDAVSWFRLGKLMIDSGESAEALDPYARAVTIAEQNPTALRRAYLERIIALAAGQSDQALADRAQALLRATQPAGATADPLEAARQAIISNDFEAALEALRPAARQPGTDEAMAARYMSWISERAQELGPWGLQPVSTTLDGKPAAGLTEDELLRAVIEASNEAYLALNGPSREVALKKRNGTRPEPTPETRARLQAAQARWVGLLIDAIRRKAPLQIWAVQGGFAPLFFARWEQQFVQRLTGSEDRIPPTTR
jgi:tetratricopeptide (TPR) repeat protein